MEYFVARHEFIFVLILVAVFIGIDELGFRFGRGRRITLGGKERPNIDALQNSLFVLLALLLAFIFSMAISRYDSRKDLVLKESNAIGTAYLRAGFLTNPQRDEVRMLLRRYVDARLGFYGAGIDQARIKSAEEGVIDLQNQLWKQAEMLAEQERHSIPLGLLIQSLNEVIDLDAARLQALNNHVPEAVLYLVLIVAIISFGFVGYRCGFSGQRSLVPVSLVAFAVALVLTIIVDIDRPRKGLIKVSQESMIELQRRFRGAGS